MSPISMGPTGADLPRPRWSDLPAAHDEEEEKGEEGALRTPTSEAAPDSPSFDDGAAPAGADRPDGSGGPDEQVGPDGTDDEIDELATAIEERDSYLDALRRLQAEFENYRKRMAKQRTDDADRASESLVDKLLPVLDTADLASSHGGGEDLAQVRAALLDALEREGLERIADAGGPFDPNVHDAVAHEPGDGDQEVAEVLRAGYRWKGRVVRPAMVKVRG